MTSPNRLQYIDVPIFSLKDIDVWNPAESPLPTAAYRTERYMLSDVVVKLAIPVEVVEDQRDQRGNRLLDQTDSLMDYLRDTIASIGVDPRLVTVSVDRSVRDRTFLFAIQVRCLEGTEKLIMPGLRDMADSLLRYMFGLDDQFRIDWGQEEGPISIPKPLTEKIRLPKKKSSHAFQEIGTVRKVRL